ncbi:exported hypothetical protein [Nitrospina gracilis 3/211]|uniref:PepSY domain-containing protein n=1 Tax=Nitrospina gracilis (strain 3/211) TaxID=1266370 RepID=M1YZ26_NITG3|nr:MULTISPECIES: hypothetical protein [Nitrospina]MCF8723636.1 hypothetical protein [Nitrospina sp. Nb-3]CCQ90722.1 exported hypothetical protein [Nitrospina gracilis 3/211]
MWHRAKIWMAGAALIPVLLVVTSSARAQTFENPGFRPTVDNPIPIEPGWKDPTYRGWELLSVPGLIATYYDLDLDGTLDYQVIRKIIRKAASEELTIKEAIQNARIDNLSVYVSYPVIYFTSKYPLFYCLGVDFRKNCLNIWVDIAEDGLNGNETKYTLSDPKPLFR